MPNIGFSETMQIEFKSDIGKLPDSDILDSVVAFANTDGGDLYLGVENDGEITGIHNDHRDITRLAAFIANKTVPPISVKTELIEYEKESIIKISVSRKTSIVATSSGKIQRRRLKSNGSPENVPMYPYEITTRLSNLSLLDFSAQPAPDAVYSDLDPLERERLRNIVRAYHGEQTLLELSDEELDKALQFVTTVDGNLTPTFSGLLIIGKSQRLKALVPTAESAVQVLSGTQVKVNESFTLPLLAAIEKINGYIEAWNQEKEMEVGMFRITIPDFDKRAFREALVNAYCHRDFSMLGRVRVQLDDTGLTISNPGGFIEGVSADNLLFAEPHGRNPALADALKRIGLAERTGRGIDRIYEGSLFYGKMLPDYSESTSVSVRLFIPKSQSDKAFISMIAQAEKQMEKSLSILSLMILYTLKQQGNIMAPAIAAAANSSLSQVRVALEQLEKIGLTETAGKERTKTYSLSKKVYNPSKQSTEGSQRELIDPERQAELVLELARKQGYVTRANVAELLHVDPPRAYRILHRLADRQELILRGKGKTAEYLPQV